MEQLERPSNSHTYIHTLHVHECKIPIRMFFLPPPPTHTKKNRIREQVISTNRQIDRKKEMIERKNRLKGKEQQEAKKRRTERNGGNMYR
jgi:hypothetical protein